jgi:hypothetical protein
MPIALTTASIIGGIATATAVGLGHGSLATVLLAAPMGGSSAALALGLLSALQSE